MNGPDTNKYTELSLGDKILREIKEVAVNQIDQHRIEHSGVIS